MTLNSSMKSLADSVRYLTFSTDEFSINNMINVLNGWHLFRSDFPMLDSDNHGSSVGENGVQKFTFSGNFNDNLYLTDWNYIHKTVQAGTNIKQAMTVETDGSLDSLDMITYNAGAGDQGTVVSKYVTKVSDNKYRAFISANNKQYNVVEFFNFSISISNGTYVKFSEPYLSVGGAKLSLCYLISYLISKIGGM